VQPINHVRATENKMDGKTNQTAGALASSIGVPIDARGNTSHGQDARATGPVIQCHNLGKEFLRGQTRVVALEEVDTVIQRGEFHALMGPSGSGKSTLLHLIAGIDKPTAGSLEVLGENPALMSEKSLARWRNAHLGFVFQAFNLIPVLTAVENVELPLKLTKLNRKERREHAVTALRLVGLEDRLHHFPRQLSGGQEQRVAMARAIVTDPDLILADEPTGNLDAASAHEVLTLLKRLNAEFGKTVVMVTHDPNAAAVAGIVHHLDKGRMARRVDAGRGHDGYEAGAVSVPSSGTPGEG
jgi:putative ABC transport system ATP-binding protein